MKGTNLALKGFLFLAALLAILLSVDGQRVTAVPLFNVGLTRFEAIPLDNSVRLEWSTDTEVGTAGFKIKRGQGGTFDYLPAPDGQSDLFIFSTGSPATGGDYTIIDETVRNGETHTYQLIEVEANGSEAMLAERSVTVGVEPSPTPITIDGGNTGGTGSGSSTPSSATTATPPPANTAVPTATTTTSTGATGPIRATHTPAPTTESADDDEPVTRVALTPLPATTTTPPVRTTNSEAANETVDPPATQPAANQVLAQGEPDSPEEEAYPATSEAGTEPNQPSTAVPAIVNSPTPYPAGTTNDEDRATPVPIGSNVQSTQTPEEAQSAAQEVRTGRLYLWAGFIAALLIFITAVAGTLLLYTRPRAG